MDEKEFLQQLSEIMELEEGKLSMSACLENYEEWDSLSALGLCVFAKSKFRRNITIDQLKTFTTVRDIFDYCKNGAQG